MLTLPDEFRETWDNFPVVPNVKKWSYVSFYLTQSRQVIMSLSIVIVITSRGRVLLLCASEISVTGYGHTGGDSCYNKYITNKGTF